MKNFGITLARMLIALFMLVLFLPFVISLCVLFFKLTGSLADGQMYEGMRTPSYGGLLVFQVICLGLFAACMFVRARLAVRAAP
jgi:UDP-N-acetylmuramyl pentapeptide phosphotransferase/UDP-N-acetylglucosamine-1-phosphate transferase